MATKKKADSVDQAEPTFSKEQLVKSATLGLPRDAVAAILKDGQQYTREQAIQLVTEFLERCNLCLLVVVLSQYRTKFFLVLTSTL